MPKNAQAHLHVAYPRHPGSPLLFVPARGGLRIYAPALFTPASPTLFPAELVEERQWIDDDAAELDRLQRAQEKHRYRACPEPHKPWTLEVFSEEYPLSTRNGPELEIGACAFSPNRRRVVAASLSGDVYVWDREKDQ